MQPFRPMLARLQQFSTLSLALAALGLAWGGWRLGWPAVGAAAAVFVLGLHALVLAVEMATARVLNRGEPVPQPTLGALARAWWGEVVTAPLVFCWRQPFRSHAIADDPEHRGQRGIVFIHGFVCNRGFWNPWMSRLKARGVPFVAVNLEPVFGPIDAYPDIVEHAVARLEQATGLPPMLVCHSMGGLAARAWLKSYAAAHRVHRVITIGTPHRGTYLGRFGQAPNPQQMRLDSVWLNAMGVPAPELASRFTCFYSNCDNIVMPASAATLPGADNRLIDGVAHVELAYHEPVVAEVLRCCGGVERERVAAAEGG